MTHQFTLSGWKRKVSSKLIHSFIFIGVRSVYEYREEELQTEREIWQVVKLRFFRAVELQTVLTQSFALQGLQGGPDLLKTEHFLMITF